jgi:hypothetical protein
MGTERINALSSGEGSDQFQEAPHSSLLNLVIELRGWREYFFEG